MCVFMCVNVCACVKVRGKSLVSALSVHLVLTGSLLCAASNAKLASLQLLGNIPAFVFHSTVYLLGLWLHAPLGAGDSNLGPHACAASASLAGPSP